MARQVFRPGQTVALRSRVGLSPVTPSLFQVQMRLTDSRGRSMYRIRNNQHDYERVEPGSNLAPQD